ncbi:MAG: hypothetical protein CMJ65_06855 [Planctomycetaceae bacterium]|nr:hypothetical protein [Planctomycetaceae bacterium]
MLEADNPPTGSQQRLHDTKAQQRRGRVGVRPGELPGERVGKVDDQLAGCGKFSLQLHAGIVDQRIALATAVVPALVGVVGIVVTEKLDLKRKPLGTDIESGQVKRLDVSLITGRMNHRQLDRISQPHMQSPVLVDLGIISKTLTPCRVLQVRDTAVFFPVPIPVHPSDRLHQFM